MQPMISVITCAHNPRLNYLDKVLTALKIQTLSFEKWEVLLIDNASDRLLSTEINLDWHPQARHIREEKLGLTPARLRGIQEAQAELIIFVDDDNVLEADYLEAALQISRDYAFLGAWGGLIKPEFEVTPPEWTKSYWELLAVREFDCDRWSNFAHHDGASPCGAGLCIRKSVGKKYAELVGQHHVRSMMDRKGKLLTSCGDSDLAFTACDIGLGKGVFTALRLTHLIPAHRLHEDYLLKLTEGLRYSETILAAFRGKLPYKISKVQRIIDFYHRLRMNPRQRRFYDAERSGETLACIEINGWKTS